MTDIYAQHDAAFANVSAYVILRRGEKVATIAFKLPRDGAGRLYAYVHWIGSPMIRGHAAGGGYDKHSAAAASAARKSASSMAPAEERNFWNALENDNGQRWDRRLVDVGFTVLQAV